MNAIDELRAIFAVRWPNFEPEEVLSPDGLKLVHNKGVFPMQAYALDKLQDFRAQLGKPVIVNTAKLKRRGWRSPKENAKINGDKFSFHTAGCAFDITVPEMDTGDVYDRALEFGFGGVGLYSTWVHIDTRLTINRAITWTQ